MKKHLFTAAIILASLATLCACYEEEEITPSGNYSPIRGGFPQGDSKYDSLIYDIKQEYGVYLLYKDITEEDLNRDWVSVGTGDIFVAGYDDEREDAAWNLPDEHLPFYVDYFYNYIFPNISTDFAKSSFPVKIYMIHNLRTEPRDFGEDSGESGSGTTLDPYKTIKLGNFDNWAISFKDDIINGTDTEYALKQLRCVFMIEALKNAMDKGEITSPDEFWTGFDFSSRKDVNGKELNVMDHKDPSKENYKYKLGFIDDLNDNFGTGQLKQLWRPLESVVSCYYWEKGKYKEYNLFNAYIKNAMWLTPEEFEARYPKSLYPMLTEKYEIVVTHMKDTYGIDLVGIAKGINK
jgi:hypothetical protein